MQDLNHNEIIALLQREKEGCLSMCDDGKPYSIPFGYVLIDETVYLSMLPQGRKWTCLQKNTQVCFTVFSWNGDRSVWASVTIEGRLEMVEDLDIIRRVVQANAVKIGIEAVEEYVEKRMGYYKKNQSKDYCTR